MIICCVDPHIRKGAYFKMENTQHLFRFQKTLKCEKFPLGVKCQYRAYAADEVIEIYEDSTTPVNHAARSVRVSWQPAEGMRILAKLPKETSTLHPQLFPDGMVTLICDAHTVRPK
jgi:hypothetical protein